MRDKRTRTFPGMASWGGGPQTCRQCAFWKGGNRYAIGTLKPAPCQKAAQMMGTGLPAVPHWAPACKYYQENPAPPGITRNR